MFARIFVVVLGLNGCAARAGDPDLSAAVSSGEVCFLPPDVASRLANSWDPVALSHAPEVRAWVEANRRHMAEVLSGSGTSAEPGAQPTREAGWALVASRVGGTWIASMGEVWLDVGPSDGDSVELHATADHFVLAPARGLCPESGEGVDLRRVTGSLFRGKVCGAPREFVLTPSFRQRYRAWSKQTADEILGHAATMGTPGVVTTPKVEVAGRAVRCEAAALECDVGRIVAYCSDASGDAEFWDRGLIVMSRAPEGGFTVSSGGGGGLCLYHSVPGVSVVGE